ncbi:PQQ-binding-like beta-propeller repeat protein [Plantactinospora sp. CA-290183]|uniref:outer membrane protein assembly factor BamB family protein n=1 Tax=Plantactinospora sp. CA-290183 TaxID=3240006 RepID=UPI003D8B5AA5
MARDRDPATAGGEPDRFVIDLGPRHAPAVIDLDVPAESPSATGPPRPPLRRRLRGVALALTGALVLATGGAVPPSPPPLWEILTVPVTGTAVDFQLTRDHLFVHGGESGSEPRIRGYELDRGRRVWATPFPVSSPMPSATPAEHHPTTGLLLLRRSEPGWNRTETTALDARTGQRRWSLPYPVITLPDERTGLVLDSVFPAGSRVEPGTRVDDRLISVSPSGEMHTAPPIGVVARAIDLATGQVLWTSPQLVSADLVGATHGRGGSVLVVTRAGRVELWEARTGAVRAGTTWTRGDPLAAISVAGQVLVQHTGPGWTVYSGDLGQERWSRAMPDRDAVPSGCGRFVCAYVTNGIEGLDPATGATLWRSDQQMIVPIGDHLVAFAAHPQLERMFDPVSGRTLLDLSDWTDPNRFGGDEPVLLLRSRVPGRASLGLLDPSAVSVRLLGTVPYVTWSCRWVPGVVACRTGLTEVRVWRYR